MIRFVPLLLAAAVASAACGPAASVAPPAPVPAPATPPAPAAETPDRVPASSAASWVMPNLVGANLQEAQDRIQALTDSAIFVTTSHDATGRGRQQVLDRNWKVCDQSVKPGQRITADTAIDFGAAKLAERC